MSRLEELSVTESVADLFKVAAAKSKRRLVRLEDPIDWELLSQVLVAYFGSSSILWPSNPLDALIMLSMEHFWGREKSFEVLNQVRDRIGGNWANILNESESGDQFGLTNAEIGHLRTVLRFVIFRIGSLTLQPLREFSDERCLEELTSLPGMSLASASTLLVRSFGRQMLPPTLEVQRVFGQMGVLPSGLTEAESLERLRRFPSGLATLPLFDGVTMLAQKVCHEVDPGCKECPVWRLCTNGRKTCNAEPASDALTFVDLFAGAGGMSLGLKQAGLLPSLAVEVNEWACRTYQANHPELPSERIISGDIREIDPQYGYDLLNRRRPDLVVGGPPCQGFSLIGKRGRSRTRFIDDPRNELYKEFIRWVDVLKPRFVVMENVPGLYSYADGAVRQDIERNLIEIGYVADDLVVDASRFGVPQRRQRVLFLGASVADFGELAVDLVRLITAFLRNYSEHEVTLRDAIADLPPLKEGEGLEAAATRPAVSPSLYALEMGRGQNRVIYHHVARPINTRDKLLYARLKPGETGADALDQGARYLMVYQNNTHHDKYRRLRYDEPCPTIMSHLAKDGHMFIHPDPKQRRSLTVREAARVQSFPDEFLFLGPRTAQFTQVGNAVPPKLARAIGEAISRVLSEVDQ